MLTLALLAAAAASVDDACDGLVQPADYDEQLQTDFLSNYPALATTLSPLHAPVPGEAGRGSLGLELAFIPPLGCGQRMVMGWTKSEDTNKVPIMPRPRAVFTFRPLLDRVYPYAGLAYVPPVPVGGTRNTVASAELGLGTYLGRSLQVGLRVHGTLQRTLGDVATKFEPEDPDYDDLYVASSSGVDAMVGWEMSRLTAYAALGFTEVSTFFRIGDDQIVTNNLHPYAGPAASLGVDALLRERLRIAGELYAAPGGHSDLTPAKDDELEPASRYGHLTTARLRLAYEL